MSDHWTIFVPDSPHFVPSEAAQQQSMSLLRSMAPQADEVKTETTEGVRFIDCGSNFERVICPVCSKEIDTGWWVERLDEEHKSGLHLNPIEVPCCRAQMTLNELTYEWEQAFGRFSLEAMNPNIGQASEEAKVELERVLGCRLRVVYRHL